LTRIIGYSAVIAAFALALAGIGLAVAGIRTARPHLTARARTISYCVFGLMAVANLAMIYGLVTHDFSISYVAQVGSRSTPLFFTIISLWGSLEGSILFWGLVLSGYTAASVYGSGRKLGNLGNYALAVLLGIGLFFYLLLLGPANPFEAMSPVPEDGPGPNPLLQNHPLMAVHPPLLYLGYVGMSVPFAFAMGALLSGELDDTWLRVTRRWTLTAWTFLSLAIIAGMWWSYDVLGWGGYWAWDPVENASFMPWLTATAFLHSAMIQERRGMLRVWNLSLIAATFLLTILGTFLTRSGVLSSVHAFTQGVVGYYFVAFIGVALIFSLVLLGGRSTELRREGHIDDPLSRDAVFLVNNLLFTAFTFTVLLGTLFPLLAEAARGVKLTVGAPFFNRMTAPVCMALLFLTGVGPMLPWRGAGKEHLKGHLRAPTISLALAVIVTLLLGLRSPYALLAFGFAAFSLAGNIQEFIFPALARRKLHGEDLPRALYRVVAANHRRYGGYTAHIGIVMIAAGITASSAFRFEKEVTLRPGETAELQGYRVRLEGVYADEEPHRWVIRADLATFAGDRSIGHMIPKLNYYNRSPEPITTPAVRSTPKEDLYINLLAFDEDGKHATISMIVEPLVFWIWTGGLVVALGGLLAAVPQRRVAPARPATTKAARRRARAGAR
jgi:cytochrome c-type biogenesis protein CcmF